MKYIVLILVTIMDLSAADSWLVDSRPDGQLVYQVDELNITTHSLGGGELVEVTINRNDENVLFVHQSKSSGNRIFSASVGSDCYLMQVSLENPESEVQDMQTLIDVGVFDSKPIVMYLYEKLGHGEFLMFHDTAWATKDDGVFMVLKWDVESQNYAPYAKGSSRGFTMYNGEKVSL